MRAVRTARRSRSFPSVFCARRSCPAQENYEIQVYGAATVPRGVTMFELHSNYTTNGRRFTSAEGELPTYHALHETIEITHGFTDWSELGFYWFMAVPAGQRLQWVGTHIRPRVTAPESWGWPVGVSISQEFGYARRAFSADTWTYELRPIIDKEMGAWYVSINPTLGEIAARPDVVDAVRLQPERRRRLRHHEARQSRPRVLWRHGADQSPRADR